MVADFSALLLRLKQQVGLHTDKEVAELLGMSVKAFHARKTRGAFPEEKLLALTARRPDLKIDVPYVLTGSAAKAVADQMLENFGSRLREVRGERSSASFAKLLGITSRDLSALESGSRRPTTSEVLRLQATHPDRSPAWLFGGDAPRLDREPDDLEVTLIQNYRACTPEAREALRQQAAFYATLAKPGFDPAKEGKQ